MQQATSRETAATSATAPQSTLSQWPVFLLFLLIMMLPSNSGEQQQKQVYSTCGAVTVTSRAPKVTYVTCIYDVDISNYGFNVLYFAGVGVPVETTLACNRLSSGGLNCHKGQGVDFDEGQDIQRGFSFTRRASFNKPGTQYRCQMVPAAADTSAQGCTVVDLDLPVETVHVVQTQPPPPACEDRSYPAVIVLLLIVIFIIIAAVLACGYVYWRRVRLYKTFTRWTDKHREWELPSVNQAATVLRRRPNDYDEIIVENQEAAAAPVQESVTVRGGGEGDGEGTDLLLPSPTSVANPQEAADASHSEEFVLAAESQENTRTTGSTPQKGSNGSWVPWK